MITDNKLIRKYHNDNTVPQVQPWQCMGNEKPYAEVNEKTPKFVEISGYSADLKGGK